MARTRRARLASSDDANSRPLVVTITHNQTGFFGRLELWDAAGRITHRDVVGETCVDVVAALALVTALTLDPLASTGPLPEASSPKPGATRAPTQRQRVGAGRPLVAAPRPIARQAPAPSWHIAFGGDASFRGGVTPDLMLTLPAFIELDLPRFGSFAPSVRAMFERSQSDVIQVGQASAAFRWTGGALEACPLTWTWQDLRAAPCLRAGLGVLQGQGRDIVPARAGQQTWFSLGAVARVEWSFLRPAMADFGLGVTAPLIRDRFFFEPKTLVHEAPPVGYLARAGVGVRFP